MSEAFLVFARTFIMLRTLFASALLLAGVSGGALAQDTGFTLSGGYTRMQLDDYELDLITFRGGYDFSEYFGVEGQLDLGIDGDTANGCPTGYVCAAVQRELDLEYGAGLYGVARLPIGETFNIFGRAGYQHADFDANFTPTGGIGDGSFAWGVGAQWDFAETSGVRFDYTRADFDGLGEADSFSLSYVLRFGG